MVSLTNDNLEVEFTSKGGYDTLLLTPAYFNKGAGQWSDANIDGGRTHLLEDGRLKFSTADYFSLYFGGVEYDVASLVWTAENITLLSRDLYGDADTLNNTSVDVVKVSSTDNTFDIGGDRTLKNIYIYYYFTLDGKGVVKKVDVELHPGASIIQNGLVLNFASVDSLSPRTHLSNVYFGKQVLGFDYYTTGEYNADWTTDAGLTIQAGKTTYFPNLLPDFNSAQWTNSSNTVIDAKTLNLATGGINWLSIYNAYPDNRIYYFNFEVQNLTGQLYVEFSLVGNSRDTITNAEGLWVTVDGVYSMEIPAGYGYQWLYVKLYQDTGTSTIYEPIVTYESQTVDYKAPTNDYLGNANMRGCVRITSSNPNNKKITRTLASNLKISAGKGIGLSIRSLDNTPITDGAFKIGLQKPDNTWVYTPSQNIFVDYNEKYDPDNPGHAEQFNLWADGLFGIDIPSGVDEIKAIRIKWTTESSIDWLLDDLFVLCWQSADNGMGSDARRTFGPLPQSTRQKDWFLRGVAGMVYSMPLVIDADPVMIIPDDVPPLSFSGITAVNVFYLDLAFNGYRVDSSQIINKEHELIIDISGLTDLFYVVSVTNTRTAWDYRIKTSSSTIVTVDVQDEDQQSDDILLISYLRKGVVDVDRYSLAVRPDGRVGVYWDTFDDNILEKWLIVFAEYTLTSRTDDQIGMLVAGNNFHVTTTRQIRYSIDISPPIIGTYANLTFMRKDNIKASTSFIYYPTIGYDVGDDLNNLAQSIQDTLQSYTVLSRSNPLNPLPRNYNLIPFLGFGGEAVASNPIGYIQEAADVLDAAGASNVIMAAGSLGYFYDRALNSWWSWGGGLRDNGIDYLTATRDMIRQGLDENTIFNNIAKHRYFFEVTTFAYEHTKRYRAQVSVNYKGEEQYLRIWYYEEPGGLYTTRSHSWDSFHTTYYQDIIDDGKVYSFQYHYILTIPAFWSMTTSKSAWAGMEEDTIYDLMSKRLDYLCQAYDTDGVIISELIHYHEGFSDNDFILFNAWCVAQGFGTQTDWPKFTHEDSNVYNDPDDQAKVWGWKMYQMKKYLTEMATIVHGHNKLLGANVNVQNIIGVVNPNNPVWTPYTKMYNPDYDTWHVDTLDYSLDRYGTNYADLLDENIVDMLFVWLYHQYSPFSTKVVTDFISHFDSYKERILLTVGLFPREDPPKECSVISVLKTVLAAGWNVCYAGYPPMLIQDDRWKNVWGGIKSYVSNTSYDGTNLIISPANAVEVPFYVRF